MSNAPQRAPRETWAAYLLWALVGGFGVHHFYIGQNLAGGLLLALSCVGVVTSIVGFGLLLFPIVWLWLFIDLFAMPSYVATANARQGLS